MLHAPRFDDVTQRSGFLSGGLKFLVLIGSVAVSLVITELVLRKMEAPERTAPDHWAAGLKIHVPSDDPELIYELRPNSVTRFAGVIVRVNSAGFRDDDRSSGKTPGTRHIVVVGDSVAFGFGVRVEDAFPDVLERLLNKPGQSTALRSRVFNLGVNGYSLAQEVRLVQKKVMNWDPDLVVLCYMLNDPDVQDGGLASYFTRQPGWRIARHLKRAAREVMRAISSEPERYDYYRTIHRVHRAAIQSHFRDLGLWSREHDVPVVVAIVPVLDPWETDYPWSDLHREIGELAAFHGLRSLDLAPAFEVQPVEDARLDVWHPNKAGHAIIAHALDEYIRAELRAPGPTI
jgi:lysophospholipase L1-like esterase